MSEYHLDTSLAKETVLRLDPFTLAYVEAMFWTLTDDDGGSCDHLGLHDLSVEGLDSCLDDCRAFQEDNAALLEGADLRQAGHDFWLTRNHHGCGYWDRREGTYPRDPGGQALTDAAHAWGEANTYIGDDNLVYLS